MLLYVLLLLFTLSLCCYTYTVCCEMFDDLLLCCVTYCTLLLGTRGDKQYYYYTLHYTHTCRLTRLWFLYCGKCCQLSLFSNCEFISEKQTYIRLQACVVHTCMSSISNTEFTICAIHVCLVCMFWMISTLSSIFYYNMCWQKCIWFDVWLASHVIDYLLIFFNEYSRRSLLANPLTWLIQCYTPVCIAVTMCCVLWSVTLTSQCCYFVSQDHPLQALLLRLPISQYMLHWNQSLQEY